MPSYTGTELARAALREIGVLDPTEAGHAELLTDAIAVGTDMIDEWRNNRLTISGVTRNVYSLTSGTQSYTIGSGGAFSQDYPQSIEYWSRIPDDDATDPIEQPMGRPLTHVEWQQVRVKTLDAAYPNKMWYDKRYAAGLGRCLFHPIPDNNDVDVVLYTYVPAITSIVAATTYDLEPGKAMAIKTNLAVELLSGRFKRPGDWSKLERRAARSLASLKRQNYVPKEAAIHPNFAIGSRSRVTNIYTGGR